MNEDDIVSLLGQHVEQVEARRKVTDAARRRGLHAPFSREAVLQILEVLSLEPGVIATVACFAKARLLLAPARPGPEKR